MVEGELLKLGKRTGMIQKRYCVVREATLFIYEDKNCQKLLKMMFLRGNTIQSNVILNKDQISKVQTFGNSDLNYLSIWHESYQETDKI